MHCGSNESSNYSCWSTNRMNQLIEITLEWWMSLHLHGWNLWRVMITLVPLDERWACEKALRIIPRVGFSFILVGRTEKDRQDLSTASQRLPSGSLQSIHLAATQPALSPKPFGNLWKAQIPLQFPNFFTNSFAIIQTHQHKNFKVICCAPYFVFCSSCWAKKIVGSRSSDHYKLGCNWLSFCSLFFGEG